MRISARVLKAAQDYKDAVRREREAEEKAINFKARLEKYTLRHNGTAYPMGITIDHICDRQYNGGPIDYDSLNGGW